MKEAVKLEGFNELITKMNQMGYAARAAAKNATEKGAKEVEAEADRKAPRKDAIGIELEEQTARQVTFKIGLKKSKWYLRFFEFGVQPQEVNTGGYFVFEGDSGDVITKTVQREGMAAQPFLRPAIKESKERVTRVMGEVFREMVMRFTK